MHGYDVHKTVKYMTPGLAVQALREGQYGRHRVKMYNIFFYTFTLMEDELNALLLCLQCHLWYLIAHSNNSKCIKFLCLHTLKAEDLLESATLINFDRTTDH